MRTAIYLFMKNRLVTQRFLCALLVALLLFGTAGTALAAPVLDAREDIDYRIPVNEVGSESFGNDQNVLYGWGIVSRDATVTGYTITATGTGEHPDRTYDIKLSSDTPADAELTLWCNIDTAASTARPIITVGLVANPLAKVEAWTALRTAGHSFSLSNGECTLEMYVFDGKNNAIHTFNFTIEEADASTDPEPENVASIEITTPPKRTTYFAGQTFDRAGMVVTATLKEDGGTVPVAGYEVAPDGPLVLGTEKVAVSFGEATVELPITILPGATIGDVKIINGQFLPNYEWSYGSLIKQNNSYYATVLYGETHGKFTFYVDDGAEVLIGGNKQTVDEDGLCTLSLPTSVDGTDTIVTVKAESNQTDYTFRCYSQAMSGLPTAVTEYFCIASQYTNGGGLGPYGINGVATLRGSGISTVSSYPYKGPTSLGNFGGYITYYYEDAIKDDPKNPYGADFLVSGNSVENSNAFAEPGNVLVSCDGSTWYTLAGSLHYSDNALWDYTITYKNNNGKATWTDNYGKSGSSYWYPQKEFYPLFSWPAGTEQEITLTGVALVPGDETNEFGNTMPPIPDFGYVDVGEPYSEIEGISNPYLGTRSSASSKRTFRDGVDCFDLKWAVDEDGLPVKLSGGIHYIKVQTANNIDNGGIGEKSTEVNMMRVAEPVSAPVGVTTAPTSITVDGKAISFTGTNLEVINGVEVSGAFVVNVETAATNVYINGFRGTSATYAKMPNHEMLRIIVQDGEKEPWIGYFNLIEGGSGENDRYSVITFDPTGGTINGEKTRTYLPEMPKTDKTFPIPEWTDRIFLGWYDAGGNKYDTYLETMPAALALTAKWKYDLKEGESSKVNVSFRLIGATKSQVMGESDKANEDINLGAPEGYKGSVYVTWIPTRSYTMNRGDTMYELFVKAIEDAKLEQKGAEKNYVGSIKAPSEHGGYWLSEFTNGQRSGWMYTVGKTDSAADQKHPDRGLLEYDLKDGDVVIWHYVNDYAYEVADWFDDAEFPSLAEDDTFYNRWLEAPDVTPTIDNAPKTGDIQQGATILAPKVTAKDGVAAAAVSASDMGKAIDDAKKNGSGAIVIEPEISGKATKISVDLPKASVSSMDSGTSADLKIVTSNGSVTIPHDALASIASQATGSAVTIVVEAVETKSLTAEQQKTVGNGAVFDISILSNGKPISGFGGKSITISLPYTLKNGETPEGVTVWYLSDAGKLERVSCKYDKDTGLAAFTAAHLSNYVVGYDAWTNPFTDVKAGDWFYDAVKYATQKELFNGTSATAFGPNTDMTRAMLVTVLYRLEGKPAVTAANPFADVEGGQWYTDAVLWANLSGIVTGYDNGLFGTNDPITREQMAVILYRYAAFKKYDTVKTNDLGVYADGGSTASYALSALKWANAEGLITGRTTTALAPSGTATRAEVATILMRVVENVAK